MNNFRYLILLLTFTVLTNVTFSQTEREIMVLDEINLARTDPTGYMDRIDAYLDYWEASDKERKVAEELKKELKSMQPVEALVFSDVIYQSCKKHGKYIIKKKTFEHSGCDYAENIQYGNYSPVNAVCDLLIDFGISDRGHRKNILNPDNKYFAVYEILETVAGMEYFFIQQFSSRTP